MNFQRISRKLLKEPVFLGFLLVLLYFLHGYDESQMIADAADIAVAKEERASSSLVVVASRLDNKAETRSYEEKRSDSSVPAVADFSQPLGSRRDSKVVHVRVLSVEATSHFQKEDVRAGIVTLNPALLAVCACESSYEGTWWGEPRQFMPDGSIVMSHFGTNDVGMCQINATYHGADASALGYNIYTKAGNIAYANVLFEGKGYQPWGASRHCWKKAK